MAHVGIQTSGLGFRGMYQPGDLIKAPYKSGVSWVSHAISVPSLRRFLFANASSGFLDEGSSGALLRFAAGKSWSTKADGVHLELEVSGGW